ncbi:MAG: hypothetical protein M3326_11315, partial [Actinomycetota bacterium]|nr:hypothetical protein [Actinomycetota bacterium]
MQWRRWAALALAAGVASTLVGVAAMAWACVPMATIQATPSEVRAGGEVMVSGIRFLGFAPVTIRLNALDGPVLGTAQMGPTSNTLFKTSVIIPADTRPGQVVLIAMQEPEPGGIVPWGVPARTLLTVVGPDGSPPPSAPSEVLHRPAGLSRASVSTSAFVLVGLGVAAAALLVAGA